MTPDKLLFYENQFLVLSQVTFVFTIVLILRSMLRTKKTRIVPTCLFYFLAAVAGWWICSKGWIFECDMVFSRHFHWYMLLAYMPIIYYMLRIFIIFLHKTFKIFPMLWWAFMLKTALDQIKK